MALEGIRIIDISPWFAAAHGTSMLADMGAEVITIEDVPRGGPVRGELTSLATLGTFLPASDVNFHLPTFYRNKKSVGINLRKEGARHVIYRLTRKSDVFASGIQASTLQKWGFDYKTVSQFNPRIIYALLSGYGRKGPDKDKPVFDLVAQARGGMMSLMGEPDSPPPAWGAIWNADSVASLMFAYSITLALLVRERTGLGQEVDTSVLGGQIAMGTTFLEACLATGQNPVKVSRKVVANPLRNIYRTKDGRWLALHMPGNARFWDRFCNALGLACLTVNPKFSSVDGRAQNAEALISLLDEAFAGKTGSEWMNILPQKGVVCSLVNNYTEVAVDPQVLANEYVATAEHPTLGPVKVVGLPVQLSKTPGNVSAFAPEYGQHTEEVLMGVGGFDWQEIAKLKEDGVIN